MRYFLVAVFAFLLSFSPAEAKHHKHHRHHHHRHVAAQVVQPAFPPLFGFFNNPISKPTEVAPVRRHRYAAQRVHYAVDHGQVIGGRPEGCPSQFCGCGASLYLFHKIIPALNLAANWLRFPRAAPAPGMAAARPGHVMVLVSHVEGDVWQVYDANSGGHMTRLHERSISRFAVVDPHA